MLMLTNVVRNFDAIVLARTCLTGNWPTGQPGQQEDTTMGDDYEYADTGSPALYSSTPAQTQPPTSSRHRSERERDRDRSDRDRDEPSRRSKHSRR